MSTTSDRLTRAAQEMKAVMTAERRHVTVRGEAQFKKVMESQAAEGWTFLTMDEMDGAGQTVVTFIPQSALTRGVIQ